MKTLGRGLSIRMLLVSVATVPALMMLLVVSTTTYFGRLNEIESDIDERGALLAAVLAESSHYGVFSGNVSSIERTMRGLMSADSSIAALEVLDAKQQPMIAVGTPPNPGKGRIFERQITGQSLDVDLFDSTTSPHIGTVTGGQAREGAAIGLVRVHLSPEPLMVAKRRNLYIAGLLTLGAAILSGMVGLVLGRCLRQTMTRVMTAIRGIRQGQYAVALSPNAGGELGELQRSIIEMAQGLAVTTQELEGRVAQRTEELQTAMQEKRDLIARGYTQLEQERERIASDIHDSMNAALIVLKMKLHHIAELAGQRSDEPEMREIGRIAQGIVVSADALYSTTRNIVKQLRPEVIDTLGLSGALQGMIRSYDALHPACRFSLHESQSFSSLRGQIAITAFRLVQESLSNVVKHSGATSATVNIEYRESTPALLITIVDNGKGFDVQTRGAGSLGLVGMRERVSAAGGSMQIKSNRQDFTEIAFELPLPPEDVLMD